MALEQLATSRAGATLLIVGGEAPEPLPPDTVTLDQLAQLVAGSPELEGDLQARSRVAEVLGRSADPEEVDAAYALFEVWWEQGATAAELFQASSGTSIATKVKALVEARKALEAQLVRDGRAVRATLAGLATKALSAAGPPRVLRTFERLEVRGVRWLTPAQRKFLNALAAALAPMPQVSWCWPSFDEPGADALTIDAVQAFESEGEASSFELRRELVSQNWAPHAAAVFGGTVPPAVPGGSVRVVSVGTPAAEARFIASELRAHIDKGVAASSLGVAYRRCAPSELELLRDACARVGVPLASSVGTPLSEARSMRAALLPFTIADAPAPERRLTRLLASPYFRLIDKGAIPLARQLSAVDFDPKRLGRFAKFEGASSLNAVCKKALEELKTLPEQGTASTYLEAWDRVRTALKFQFVLDEQTPAGRLAVPLARIAHEEREAAAAFEKLSRALSVGNALLSRREFVRRVRLEAKRIALPPFPGEGVYLGKVGALPPREFSTFFLAGMSEEWLHEPTREYFLSEELAEIKPLARRTLFRTHVRPDGENMPFREAAARSEFCSAFGESPRVVCTWSRKDSRDEDAKMLRFLEELPAAAVEHVLNTPPAAPAPAEDWVDAYAEREKFFATDDVPPGPYSGATGLRLSEKLDFPRERPLSATNIRSWGNCGFQGFWRNVVRLSAEQEASEVLDPLEKGTVLHQVLAKVSHDNWTEDSLRAAVESEVPWDFTPELRNLEVERAYRQLKRIMENYPQPFPDATPAEREETFGGKGHEVELPGLSPDEPSVFIKGRIDRIDRGSGFVGTIDYKTKTAKPAEYRRQLLTSDFQLPFYLLAQKGSSTMDAAWVSLTGDEHVLLSRVLSGRRGKKQQDDELIYIDTLLAVDAKSREAAAAEEKPNLANAVHGLFAKLRRGEFPPRSVSCRNCEYAGLCRREVEDEW